MAVLLQKYTGIRVGGRSSENQRNTGYGEQEDL